MVVVCISPSYCAMLSESKRHWQEAPGKHPGWGSVSGVCVREKERAKRDWPVWRAGPTSPHNPRLRRHTWRMNEEETGRRPVVGRVKKRTRDLFCRQTLSKTAPLWASIYQVSVQFSSVAQSCPTLCNPMNRSTPGLPVHHQLPEFTQTHVH